MIKPRKIFQYILMLLIILYGQSVWLWMLPVKDKYYLIDILSILVVFILIALRKKIKRIYIYKSLIGCVLLLIYSMIALYSPLYTSIRIILPFGVLFVYLSDLYCKNELNEIFEVFSNIVFFLAVVSLIFYIFGTILHLLPYFYDSYSWTGLTLTAKNYFHLMYEAQTENFFGIMVIRNCGIFCEAPSYAVPLILALSYELFFSSIIRKLRINILLATIFSTFSTKALIIACIAIALKLLEYALEKGKKSTLKQFIRFICPVLIALAIIIALAILDQKTDSASYIDRMDNIQACIQAFEKNIFFGVGPGNEKAITQYCLNITRWQGLSMGIPVLIAEGGLCFTAFYVYGLVNAIVNSNKKFSVICFGIIHILILFTSNIPYFLSTIFILAAEYSVVKNHR